MKLFFAAPLILALSGCAMSAGGLGKGAPEQTFNSTKKAEYVAGCIYQAFNADPDMVKLADDHWMITRKNGYGIPTVRWDIYDIEGGSRIEVRSSIPINRGIGDLQKCL